MSPNKKAAVTHIGHHVIPNALAQEMKVYAYQYDGYWKVSRGSGGGGEARMAREGGGPAQMWSPLLL